MILYEIGYQTSTGNVMPITMYGGLMHRSDLPIMVGEDRVAFCQWKIGCKGKNGGCPPFAPELHRLKPTYSDIYVIVVELDMAGPLTYGGWWKGVSAPGLYILTYADRLSMNYAQRALKYFESLGYYTIGLSNCPSCRPKDCKVLQGGKCSKPKKRRYSMEATGVFCDLLHQDLFGEVLPWWFPPSRYIPTAMYRYAGILTGKPASVMDDLLLEFVFNDKSYTEKMVDLNRQYDIATLTIPNGKFDAGEPYQAYRIPIERMVKQ